MDFSQRIKELRSEKQITQRELATHLHLSSNIVCEWEKGRCSPNIDTLKKLSVLFECSIDYLVGNTDDFGNVTTQSTELPADEQELLANFRTLPREEKVQARSYVRYLAERRAGFGNKHA